LPPIAPATTPISQLRQYNMSSQKRSIGIIVATGPFTMDNDTLFEPLTALLDVIRKERPNLVILVSFSMMVSISILRCF
jgi:hypothetical protein